MPVVLGGSRDRGRRSRRRRRGGVGSADAWTHHERGQGEEGGEHDDAQGRCPSGAEPRAQAAQQGRDSTVDMVAKLGRAARLGERSRGVPDAGATSCCLILTTLADSVGRRLSQP